jgi:hypothetical protein
MMRYFNRLLRQEGGVMSWKKKVAYGLAGLWAFGLVVNVGLTHVAQRDAGADKDGAEARKNSYETANSQCQNDVRVMEVIGVGKAWFGEGEIGRINKNQQYAQCMVSKNQPHKFNPF